MALPKIRKIIGTVFVIAVVANFTNNGYFNIMWKGMHDHDHDSYDNQRQEAEALAKEQAEKANGVNFKSEEEVAKYATEVAESANVLGEEYDAEFVKATVVRVVDGDTIVVNIDGDGDYKVRLIGVNTPESVASAEYTERTGNENCEEGKIASDFTKDLLSNYDCVYLEEDEASEDRYGRELRYVWLEIPEDKYDIHEVEAKMLNGYLVSQGYAEVATYAPNTEYEDYFVSIAAGTEDSFSYDDYDR